MPPEIAKIRAKCPLKRESIVIIAGYIYGPNHEKIYTLPCSAAGCIIFSMYQKDEHRPQKELFQAFCFFCFCRELSAIAVAFLLLLWPFFFSRELFAFAVAFLFLQRAFWFCRKLLFLPWPFCFCCGSCGPPYYKGRAAEKEICESINIQHFNLENILFCIYTRKLYSHSPYQETRCMVMFLESFEFWKEIGFFEKL